MKFSVMYVLFPTGRNSLRRIAELFITLKEIPVNIEKPVVFSKQPRNLCVNKIGMRINLYIFHEFKIFNLKYTCLG